MLAKLIVIIIVAGATACALLVNRQHRIDTANEIAVIHHRLLDQEQALWRLRSDIANRTRPDQIRRKIDNLGGMWVAIPAPPARRARKEEELLAQAPGEADNSDHSDSVVRASGL